MPKLIIKYEEGMKPRAAIDCANDVIAQGRISESRHGKQFCFLTSFKPVNKKGKAIQVCCTLTSNKTDVFDIRYERG